MALMRDAGSSSETGSLRETHQGDPIATHRVLGRADTDGKRHSQILRSRTVELVIAPKASGDRGDEAIVDGAASAAAAEFEVLEAHLQDLQMPASVPGPS